MQKIVWIIGGSTGIGFELCKFYLEDGYSVVVSSRNASSSPELQKLSLRYPSYLEPLDMDVSDTHSVEAATKKAWDIYGEINLCIYNAGVYESMKVEEWKIEHFEQMTQINYLGALRVTNALIPFFLENSKGRFAFNASVSSYFGLPYGGGYSAPKAALLNFCESIQPELAPKNIQVQVINHGFVKTRLTAKNDFEMPQLLEPQEAAKIIFEKLTHDKNFEIKFPFMLSSFLHFLRVIPYRIAFYFTSKAL
ncbi:MAG: NAD(P)-dependent dehydrogenase (short-subunit alcohol dehydrogenase family) [Sulfurimonas sp.]|jgi:NAD(P)-dependent dehydrogenase (short-subunit alcohol dehydrogenase family)|uniref:SDR family NAD(P)-dependent oxidoreductase n=1 Tax=Sulfurimonas sp. TaxID=2022749 RepID=UPI0039E42005